MFQTTTMYNSGDGEYSIDGFNFQSNNTFNNISGGVYDVQVRDKKGVLINEKLYRLSQIFHSK
jgi:hypothetical protein